MRKLLFRRLSAAVMLGLAFVAAGACSAGKGTTGSALEGAGNGSGASAGLVIATGSGGSSATGNIDVGNNGGSNVAAGGGCQHIEVNFVPKIPYIFVLVDRSDSMFTPDSMTHVASWDALKTGVLDVITKLQGQIRFGFGAFTGQQASNGEPAHCPIFDPIAPALNNADAISKIYQPLAQVKGAKGETPVTEVLPLVQDLLTKAGSDGDKYILFVTDGEPDFCDDSGAECPVDALVGGVQKLAANGISTIVFGLKSQLSNISDQTLQAVANAGAKQPVAAPFGGRMPQDICYACQSLAGWKAEWGTATPDCTPTSTKQTLGTYSPTGGTATVYHPDPADQAALTAQIGSVVSGIKSCTFDLGGKISVDQTRLNEASVSIEGNVVPLSMDNGWRMNSDTQLELVGSACTTWRDPKNAKIDFNFPCDIIILK